MLLVEDIVDTGLTTRYLLQTLAGRSPRSIAICTLLDRTVRRIVPVPVDFRCFEIPDPLLGGRLRVWTTKSSCTAIWAISL